MFYFGTKKSRELELSLGLNKLYFMRSDNIDLGDRAPTDLGALLTLLRTSLRKKKPKRNMRIKFRIFFSYSTNKLIIDVIEED